MEMLASHKFLWGIFDEIACPLDELHAGGPLVDYKHFNPERATAKLKIHDICVPETWA